MAISENLNHVLNGIPSTSSSDFFATANRFLNFAFLPTGVGSEAVGDEGVWDVSSGVVDCDATLEPVRARFRFVFFVFTMNFEERTKKEWNGTQTTWFRTPVDINKPLSQDRPNHTAYTPARWNKEGIPLFEAKMVSHCTKGIQNLRRGLLPN
jgi:hypothetical protein